MTGLRPDAQLEGHRALLLHDVTEGLHRRVHVFGMNNRRESFPDPIGPRPPRRRFERRAQPRNGSTRGDGEDDVPRALEEISILFFRFPECIFGSLAFRNIANDARKNMLAILDELSEGYFK